MYALTIQNNYIWDIKVSNGNNVSKEGGTKTFNKLGSLYLTLPGMGEISFIYLADKKLDGYPFPSQKWGVLIKIGTIESYYRYNDSGQLTATIDSFGCLTLSTTNGDMIEISLPELTIK
ncbi:hypothetical protein [uncultured Tenacibaculum sp.]|uniref:hypothetical protein n=1 Tax=uncultured Tenacibaculum sp. TaxID=174713 RepID=UPI00262CEB50|nr:hypothetical protein [uncultured Tenacibaculum sp.]